MQIRSCKADANNDRKVESGKMSKLENKYKSKKQENKANNFYHFPLNSG
jgi:hypothetical protein